MITFFNRKEICVCQSMERFNEIRKILIEKNVKYSYRVIDRNGSNIVGSQRGRTGTFGQNMNTSETYYIYVHKKDYDDITGLVGRR